MTKWKLGNIPTSNFYYWTLIPEPGRDIAPCVVARNEKKETKKLKLVCAAFQVTATPSLFAQTLISSQRPSNEGTVGLLKNKEKKNVAAHRKPQRET